VLSHLNIVELSEVLVSVLLTVLVGPLVSEQLAGVDTDEASPRDVVQAAQTPTPAQHHQHTLSRVHDTSTWSDSNLYIGKTIEWPYKYLNDTDSIPLYSICTTFLHSFLVF